MTDQQRADFLRAEGFALDTMPFFESLFSEGVRFPHAYTSMPICTPARISLMTGRFPKAHGVTANWSRPEPTYGADLPQILSENGYVLGMFGKTHFPKSPQFDAWRPYTHTSGRARADCEVLDKAFDDWITDLNHWVAAEPTPFPVDCQYPVRIVDDCISWIEGHRSVGAAEPFFGFVSFPEPHSPYQVPQPYYGLFPPAEVPPPVVGKESLQSKSAPWQLQYEAIRHYHPA